MDYTVLEKSPLFAGIPAVELRELLETTPHHIQCYDKGETIFHLMEPATRIGIILEGRIEAQKAFPNGSQVNVSVRNPGEMIGPAAGLLSLTPGSVVILFLWITDLREIFLRIQLLVRVDVADVKHRPCRFISSVQTASPAQHQSYSHS